VLLAFVTLPAGAQSLAEASEAAKKIKHEWPASTYIAPPAPVLAPTDGKTVAVTAPTAADASTKALETAPVGSAAKNEDYWRARMRPLTAQLATDLATVTSLETRHAELQAKFNSMKTVFQQQLVAPEMFRVQTDLTAAIDRVTAATAAIDDLKEQGRKAGALPGWFR